MLPEQELHPTVQTIYEAIVRLLRDGSKEPDEISLSDIARESYLQKSSIAYHFASAKDMMDSFCAWYCWGYTRGNRSAYEPAALEPDPVRAFCRFVDACFLPGASCDLRFNDEGICRKCSRHLLRRADRGREAQAYFSELFRWQHEQVKRLFQPYLDAGILEPARFEAGIADQWLVSLGAQMIWELGLEAPGMEAALRRAIENIKRTMLRDGLYIPPERQRQDE